MCRTVAIGPFTIAPLLVHEAVNFGNGVGLQEYRVEDLADQGEPLRVGLHFPQELVITVALRCPEGDFTACTFLFHPPIDSERKIDAELLGLGTLHRRDEGTVIGQIHLVRSPDLFDDAFSEEPSDGTGIQLVAGKPVNVPAQDSIRLAALELFDHEIEDRASRFLSGTALFQRFNDMEVQITG